MRAIDQSLRFAITLNVAAGPSFAHAAAWAVVEAPGDSHNPLVLCGEHGVGKTHLLHAIGNEVLRTYPETKVVYLQGSWREDLPTVEGVAESADLLLVDGVARDMDRLLSELGYLHGRNKRIVLAGEPALRDLCGSQTWMGKGLFVEVRAERG